MKIKYLSIVRVVGVTLVLIYHFFPQSFPGGFFGVDVFFTFSGFLITSLFIDEIEKNNIIKLKDFFIKRFYRIVPSLIFFTLVTAIFLFFAIKDLRVDILKQTVSSLGFVTNYYEILTGGDYEAQFVPHIFIHTWSLAIEVHLYIFWGIFVFFTSKRVIRKRGSNRDKSKSIAKFRLVILLASLVFMTISLISSWILLAIGKSQSTIYFLELSHSYPFFIGSIIGAISGIKVTLPRFKRFAIMRNKRKIYLMVIAPILVLIVMGRYIKFTSNITYIVGFLIASLSASIIILGARGMHEIKSEAEPRIIGFLSDISYGIYLFHWPFIIIFRYKFSNEIAVVITLILTIIFASISFYFVDKLCKNAFYNVIFSNKVKNNFIKYPITIMGSLAVCVILILSYIAPPMGDLEKELWLNTLEQDSEKIISTRETLNQKEILKNNEEREANNIQQGVTMIGDSVMLGNRKLIQESIENSSVDAMKNRNLYQGFKIIQREKENGTLREKVVLAIGANPVRDYKETLNAFLEEFPKGHKLILVTPFDRNNGEGGYTQGFADYEREIYNKKIYDFLTIADWNQISLDNLDLYEGTDGVHFAGKKELDELYIKAIQEAVKRADNISGKK